VTRVIGVDACKKGWVGVTSDLRGYFGATVDQLVATADSDGELGVVAIDISIGLPLTGIRQADVLARRLVGKRKSSVFPTPIRRSRPWPDPTSKSSSTSSSRTVCCARSMRSGSSVPVPDPALPDGAQARQLITRSP
jgi:hypothetical protein